MVAYEHKYNTHVNEKGFSNMTHDTPSYRRCFSHKCAECELATYFLLLPCFQHNRLTAYLVVPFLHVLELGRKELANQANVAPGVSNKTNCWKLVIGHHSFACQGACKAQNNDFCML